MAVEDPGPEGRIEPVHAERIDDEDLLDEVPFGRNRLLKLLAAGVFGFAVQAVRRAEPAEARHNPTPAGCYGYRACHNCWYEYCTSGCSYPRFLGCRSGTQCWTSCYRSNRYRCCDYMQNGYPCICRGRIGYC